MLKRRESTCIFLGGNAFLWKIETESGNVLVQTTRSELDVTLYLNGFL
jgi:hypothetical protein